MTDYHNTTPGSEEHERQQSTPLPQQPQPQTPAHLPNPQAIPTQAQLTPQQGFTPIQHTSGQGYYEQTAPGQAPSNQPQQNYSSYTNQHSAPQTQSPYGSTHIPQQQVYPGYESMHSTQAQYHANHAGQYYEQEPQSAAPAQFTATATSQRSSGKGIAFLVGLLGVIVGAALSVGVLYIATSGFSFTGTVDTSTIVIDPADEDTGLAEAVAAKVTPSVVNIDVYATQSSNPLEDFFGYGDESSNGDSSTEQTGLGSGVILTADGYIVTNYHVIEDADRLMVNVGEEQYEATVVGSDPSSDLAVIKVNATGLTPIEIGDSDEVNVGEWVMAVGSPFGLEKSVSTGIVSALYRSTAMQSQSGITIYANLIQTDAAINPGNSGGALVNDLGELIGINTLISSTSGSSSGVGFALPVNYAFNVAEQIINGDDVEHPFLGVTLYSVDASTASQLGVSVDSGAYIESVQEGSPANEAGLQAGDVIVAVNKKPISTSAELIIEIRGFEIGSAVDLTINRGGTEMSISVVLGSTTS